MMLICCYNVIVVSVWSSVFDVVLVDQVCKLLLHQLAVKNVVQVRHISFIVIVIIFVIMIANCV